MSIFIYVVVISFTAEQEQELSKAFEKYGRISIRLVPSTVSPAPILDSVCRHQSSLFYLINQVLIFDKEARAFGVASSNGRWRLVIARKLDPHNVALRVAANFFGML